MGDIARKTQYDEEYFYKTFGIDGEILVDHAWGIEPVTMQDIKAYKSEGHSLSNGQVLPRPYKYQEAKLVFREMIEVLFTDMFSKNLVTQSCSWWVSFDYKSLEACPGYDGPLSIDFYGRLHPKHSNGTVKLPTLTNNIQIVTAPLLKQFDDKTDHRLLYRRLGVCANDVMEDTGSFQLNMFIDYEALEKDRKLQGAMLEVRRKFGANRKNATDLPGKPDIVLPKYRTCIFVNGCFWHVHVGCKYFVWPQNNADFWRKKLLANKERDKTVTEKLRESGWRVITIWECELKGDKAKNTLESLAWVIKASSQCRTGGDIDGKDDSGIDPNTI